MYSFKRVFELETFQEEVAKRLQKEWIDLLNKEKIPIFLFMNQQNGIFFKMLFNRRL